MHKAWKIWKPQEQGYVLFSHGSVPSLSKVNRKQFNTKKNSRIILQAVKVLCLEVLLRVTCLRLVISSYLNSKNYDVCRHFKILKTLLNLTSTDRNYLQSVRF